MITAPPVAKVVEFTLSSASGSFIDKAIPRGHAALSQLMGGRSKRSKCNYLFGVAYTCSSSRLLGFRGVDCGDVPPTARKYVLTFRTF